MISAMPKKISLRSLCLQPGVDRPGYTARTNHHDYISVDTSNRFISGLYGFHQRANGLTHFFGSRVPFDSFTAC